MASNVGKITPAVPPPQPPQPATEAVKRAPRNDGETQDFRLIIEEGPAVGTFIYKTVDRSTGEVVNQFPREEVLKLRDSPSYTAGAVVQTKA